jgi:hypothetical protein
MIHIHGIPYIITFIMIKNNVLNVNYSMLLSRPLLHYAKVFHDGGTNLIIIESNGIIKYITMTKKIDATT